MAKLSMAIGDVISLIKAVIGYIHCKKMRRMVFFMNTPTGFCLKQGTAVFHNGIRVALSRMEYGHHFGEDSHIWVGNTPYLRHDQGGLQNYVLIPF